MTEGDRERGERREWNYRFEALVNGLNSDLPAEIALRRKQYEYYRDKLLTFQPIEPPPRFAMPPLERGLERLTPSVEGVRDINLHKR